MRGFRSFRLSILCLFVALALVSTGSAWADTKSEMIAIMDKIGANKPGAEALIDWDNLDVKYPQVKNMDVRKMYAGFDEANKKAFRTSFLQSFAASFQQKAQGHTFSEVAKKKGVLEFKDRGPRPMILLRSKKGAVDLKLGFVRKRSKLQLQSIIVNG
jgi:hypothetical protein